MYGDDILSGYVLSVIGIVVLSAVFTCIIPEGKTASMIRGIAKIACVAVIVAPILQFFQSGEIPSFLYKNTQENFSQSGIETDTDFIQYYSEMRVKETQTCLQNELLEKYGVETQILLEWEWQQKADSKISTDEIYITKIKVSGMENQDESMRKEVKEYLSKNYCSEVQIE